MEKVTLTKAQADALEALKDIWSEVSVEMMRETLIQEKLDGGWDSSEFRAASTIGNDDFFKALLIGYVVEQSPEDFIKEMYDRHLATFRAQRAISSDGGDYSQGVLIGIRLTLRHLGKKIKGVSD